MELRDTYSIVAIGGDKAELHCVITAEKALSCSDALLKDGRWTSVVITDDEGNEVDLAELARRSGRFCRQPIEHAGTASDP